MLGSSAVSVRSSVFGSALMLALLGGTLGGTLGCSSASSDPVVTADPDTGSPAGDAMVVDPRFANAPNSEVNSTSGALHVALRTAPYPATLGPTAFELTVTDPSGAPVDGLTLDVTPWMPAHGHGSIPKPVATPTGFGRYTTTTTNISMVGKWILKIDITGGTLTAPDYAEPFLNAK
jgi:hypothetical protein